MIGESRGDPGCTRPPILRDLAKIRILVRKMWKLSTPEAMAAAGWAPVSERNTETLKLSLFSLN